MILKMPLTACAEPTCRIQMMGSRKIEGIGIMKIINSSGKSAFLKAIFPYKAMKLPIVQVTKPLMQKNRKSFWLSCRIQRMPVAYNTKPAAMTLSPITGAWSISAKIRLQFITRKKILTTGINKKWEYN